MEPAGSATLVSGRNRSSAIAKSEGFRLDQSSGPFPVAAAWSGRGSASEGLQERLGPASERLALRATAKILISRMIMELARLASPNSIEFGLISSVSPDLSHLASSRPLEPIHTSPLHQLHYGPHAEGDLRRVHQRRRRPPSRWTRPRPRQGTSSLPLFLTTCHFRQPLSLRPRSRSFARLSEQVELS